MESTRLTTRLKRACVAARLPIRRQKVQGSILGGKIGRGAMRCSLGILLLAVGLFVRPTAAAGTMILKISGGFDAVTEGGASVGQGNLAPGTSITLSATGKIDSLSLPSFTTSGITYTFNAPPPSSIPYTYDSTTGQLNFTSSIITSVTRAGTTVALTTPISLTTGSTVAGTPCAGVPTTTLHGSPVNLTTGAVTLIGGSCVPTDPSVGGPSLVEVKLSGLLSPPATVPEPGTAALLGCGLGGLAFAVARRQHV